MCLDVYLGRASVCAQGSLFLVTHLSQEYVCVKQPKMSQLIQKIIQHGPNGLQRFRKKSEPFIMLYRT